MTPWTVSARFLCPWGFYHPLGGFLFPSQGSSIPELTSGLLHYRHIFYCLSCQRSISLIGGELSQGYVPLQAREVTAWELVAGCCSRDKGLAILLKSSMGPGSGQPCSEGDCCSQTRHSHLDRITLLRRAAVNFSSQHCCGCGHTSCLQRSGRKPGHRPHPYQQH